MEVGDKWGAIQRIRAHFAAHLDTALADGDHERARAANSLLADLDTLRMVVEYEPDRIEAAIEADRAQRENDGSIHAAVIAALWDRANDADDTEENRAASGAQWIEDEPDEFWEEFAGPMLDDIERKFA